MLFLFKNKGIPRGYKGITKHKFFKTKTPDYDCKLKLKMPSKDTISFRITKSTAKELERIREKLAEDLGIDVKSITKKQAEIAMRLKAMRGTIKLNEERDIILGKII